MRMVCTKASFRIMGKDLDPAGITEVLNICPDQAHRCGEPNVGTAGQRYANYTEGLWALRSALDETRPLAEHLEELVSKLWQHTEVLQELRKRGYRMDIFIGVFDLNDNTGFVLSNALLMRLMRLGVDLDLDIYPS